MTMRYIDPQVGGSSNIGKIVYSLHGHDKGRYYVVIFEKENYQYIADGRKRLVIAPKKKNPAHLTLTEFSVPDGCIVNGCVNLTNKELKILISRFLRIKQIDV